MAESTKLARRERSELKGRMRNFLLFLPNMVRLLGRLLKDDRVAMAEKALFAGAIVYAISPIDFIPDVFPFIGQVDDLYVIALVLLRLVNRTDERIVREHWSGGGDIVKLAETIAGLAPKILPQRVARIITARVELAPAGQLLQGITKADQALVLEVPGEEQIKVPSVSGMAN